MHNTFGFFTLYNSCDLSWISRNQLIFQTRGSNEYRNLIVVCTDKTFASIEVNNTANLILGKLQYVLHCFCLLCFKAKDDFCLRVRDDSLAVFTILESKQVRNILRCENGRSTVTTNDFKDTVNEICCSRITGCTNQLPSLIDDNCFTLSTVLLNARPQEVHNDKHTYGLHSALQIFQIENNELIFEINIGLVVKAGRRTGNKTAKNMGYTMCVFVLLKRIIQVANDRHRLYCFGPRNIDRSIIVSDTKLVIRLNDGFIDKLFFLVCQIRNENMEEGKHL